MINAYDILVNFKKIAYDFYEWDKDDEIKHIKKILCFKTNEKTIIDFLYNNVKLDLDFLKKIENKTEFFSDRKVRIIKYACVLYCNLECVCFLFDNNGFIIERSKLLFDEADDIISTGNNQKELNIEYSIISPIQKIGNYTRKEINDMNILLKYINNLYEKNKIDELKYLYYECFKKEEDSSEKFLLKFKESIKSGDFVVINKLNALLKLIKS